MCDGDVEPKRDLRSEVALKLFGQWYVGPKYYFSSGMNGAAFYWPSKKNREDVPQHERADSFGHVIEIFLTGRHRWPTPLVERPWETEWPRFAELQAKGMLLERTALNAELERVTFRQPDGMTYQFHFYIATKQLKVRGQGPPILSCDISKPPSAQDTCMAGEFWQADVYARSRFSAKHAQDWPAIHQEVVRILNLAKPIQP